MPSAKNDLEQLDQLRKDAGRVNQSEFSKFAQSEKSQDIAKARNDAKRFGRINVAEYKAITAKPQRRKAIQRKRVAGK
jgi:hypothetical protein